jgi:hypothetical protein
VSIERCEVASPVPGAADARSPLVPVHFDEDLDPEAARVKRTDPEVLRILATWIAKHDHEVPTCGALVDRDFVVLDALVH